MRGKRRAGGNLATALKRGKLKRAKRSSADSGNGSANSAKAALAGNDALARDVPQEVSFWLSDGRVVRSAVGLADAVSTMSDEVYAYHANQFRNDFADWIRDIIKDGELAYAVRKAANKKGLEEAIRKRLKGQLRIEEPVKTILEEPAEKPAVAKPSVASVAAVAKASPPQLARRKDSAFVQHIRQLKVVREKAAGIKNKTIISLPEKAVRDIGVAGSVKAVKPVKPVGSVKPVVSPAAMHSAVLKKSSKNKRIVRSADSATPALGKREAELLRKERELNEDELKLNHARVELIRKKYELLKERGALEKEKFEKFISKRINGNSEAPVMLKAQQAQSAYQQQSTQQTQQLQSAALDSPPASSVQFSRERVEAMIREAKESIAQGNSHLAVEKFLAAQSLLSRTPLEPGEKRSLNYDLMEIEADIRLEKLKAVQ
ncbi:hypothetical protein HYV82_06565 [Candidatus Woesearchaeota archaeon]|nr:hypothetical protein [Candidatus Woesearchaeota archaeon]